MTKKNPQFVEGEERMAAKDKINWATTSWKGIRGVQGMHIQTNSTCSTPKTNGTNCYQRPWTPPWTSRFGKTNEKGSWRMGA